MERKPVDLFRKKTTVGGWQTMKPLTTEKKKKIKSKAKIKCTNFMHETNQPWIKLNYTIINIYRCTILFCIMRTELAMEMLAFTLINDKYTQRIILMIQLKILQKILFYL